MHQFSALLEEETGEFSLSALEQFAKITARTMMLKIFTQ
jgi:hypothetical protein